MSNTNKVTPDLLEKMVVRFSQVSERIVKDIEHEIHQVDNRMKAFMDQGEAATHRLVESLDKEFRTQMSSLRKEVASLSHQLTALRSGTALKVTEPNVAAKPGAAKPKASAKPVATGAASAKKATLLKTATPRTPAKKVAPKRAA